MKSKLRVLVVVLLFAAFATAQTEKSVAGSAFAGTWQGTSNGLPSIDLKIENAGSSSQARRVSIYKLGRMKVSLGTS